MEELIKKGALLEEMTKKYKKRYAGTVRACGFMVAKDMVKDAPTITESEIRAKAIDEFAEKMKWEYENSIGISQREIDFANAIIDMVAKKLKEE